MGDADSKAVLECSGCAGGSEHLVLMIGSPIQQSHVKVSWFNMLLTLDCDFNSSSKSVWPLATFVLRPCSLQVVGQILEIEDMVQTDVTRKRMKHLAHLPLSGRLSVPLHNSNV